MRWSTGMKPCLVISGVSCKSVGVYSWLSKREFWTALRCVRNAEDLTHVLHLIGFELHDAFIYVLYRRLLEFFLVFYLNLKSIFVRFLIAQRSRCLSMFFYLNPMYTWTSACRVLSLTLWFGWNIAFSIDVPASQARRWCLLPYSAHHRRKHLSISVFVEIPFLRIRGV